MIFAASALVLGALSCPVISAEEIDPAKLEAAREIAGASILAVIGPLQTTAEVEQIIGENPDLTEVEADRLRVIGKERADEIGQRALEAEAQALAQALSLADLTAIAVYERSEAAANRRAVTPMVAASVMQGLQGIDYKAEVKARFCEESGKLCTAP